MVIQGIVRAIRNARSEYDVEPARRIVALFNAGEHAPTIQRALPLLATLARLDENQARFVEDGEAPRQAVALAEGGVTVFLPLAGMVDLEAERRRIEKELQGIDQQLSRIEGLLDNPGFTGKAPADVIQREKDRQAEFEVRRAQLAERLESL